MLLDLLPIHTRKRVNRQDCSFLGNYRRDVDDGIHEEVRILNEEMQICTVASCEGHLPFSSAYILGHISDKKQRIFKKFMTVNHIIPIRKSKNMIEFCFEEVDYNLNISIDGYYALDSDDGFRLDVVSGVEGVSQDDWDRIRKNGFTNAINIIKKAFS